MRAKYFTADTQETATTAASAFFGCDIAHLIVEDVTIKGVNTPEAIAAGHSTFIAYEGTNAEITNMNSYFTLFYEQDGVYLELYEKRGHGQALDNDILINYLKRKNVSGLNLPAVQSLMEKGLGRAKIAPAQQEYIFGEDMTVTISNDEREATVRLLEPEPNGPSLTPEQAKKILAENGVIHGIDDESVSRWLTAKLYNEPYVVARATPPVDGEDGKLLFHFSTDERTGKPKEIGGGRVDYRSLDLFISVTENQLLVTRTEATEGQPGITVKGNQLKQKPGKDAVMPRGKNIRLNNERTEIRAACAGMVEYVNNALNVSNVYSVKGDCDMSTGNIDFEGSVQISGSVRAGSTVKATDGINIGGSVESATIIAGGNVEVKGGMQGSDKGHIESGSAVTVMFVERGKVTSDGPITVDVSIHSILETASTIHALGKRGAIIGGRASAAGDIVTNFIGSLSNTKTTVEVGFMPRKRARLEALEADMQRLEKDQLKLTQLEAYLAKTKDTLDKATWDKLNISGIENKRINEETAAANLIEIEHLKHEMANATSSKIHVFETAFAGSRINIGTASLILNDDISFATFKYNNGEITYGPCEKSKGDFK